MRNHYRESVRALADALGMSDIDVADHYNSTFGTRIPAPPYKHLSDENAAKLLTSLSSEAEKREGDRTRRRSN